MSGSEWAVPRVFCMNLLESEERLMTAGHEYCGALTVMEG
jgi:hypothetical protein